MKQCTKCKETKPLTEFNKNKKTKDGLQFRCKLCRNEYYRKYNLENKQKIKQIQQKWREENKEWVKSNNKKYYKENKEKIKESYKDYKKKYLRKKRIEDPMFKLKENVRTRTYQAIKGKYKKNKRTIEYLGCNFLFYKDHMQKQFKKGMTWENYGEWHIDHIIPLASANTEEELIKLFHYTNTQPLWAEENIKKSDKIYKAY